MKAQEITDVLTVRDILAANTSAAETIAALVDWKNGAPYKSQGAPYEPEPVAEDPEPEPPAPAKKAPAKAPTKAPAKPKAKPAPVADDDDADF